MKQFKFILILSLVLVLNSLAFADVVGTKIQGPALIEGFNAVTSASGTTTLTKDSQTKQILNGTQNQNFDLPSATTIPLSRKFHFINNSSGTLTIRDYGSNILTTVNSGEQKEAHLRIAGSPNGTWDIPSYGTSGGGGAWGSITGTLSDQTDLQSALDLKASSSALNLKAPLASPTFTGTIGTPLTASRVVVTDGSSNLAASSVSSTTLGYLDVSGSLTTLLNGKATTDLSNLASTAVSTHLKPIASGVYTLGNATFQWDTAYFAFGSNKAVTIGATGDLQASATTSTELGYVNGVTSAIQTQLDSKQARSTLTTKGDMYVATASATVARQAAGANGTTLLYDSNVTNGVRAGTPVGTDNYMKANPSAESNTVAGWVTYSDLPQSSPVDCAGGTPNTTWAANNSAPVLNESYQFLATLNTGATRQGEGISYAFSIPTKYNVSPAVHQIEFDYAIAGGAFVAGNGQDLSSAGDSTFSVWIYDVTNARLIQPSTYRIYSNVGGKFVANFQNSAGSTSYRLCIHKGTSATVSGTNITVKFDDFKIDSTKYVYGTPISDWTPFTSTVTNFTVSAQQSLWRRVGDSMQIRFFFNLNSAVSSTLRFNMP
ncbi:MAG: hypothetical protein JNL11_17530, partial [Bdellovibrionaceae bacterium]|nr:hypothetical protein [Pseudobdellovibrionaceae bacterium]